MNNDLVLEILKSKIKSDSINNFNSLFILSDIPSGFNKNTYNLNISDYKIKFNFTPTGRLQLITFTNLITNKIYKSNIPYNNYFELLDTMRILKIQYQIKNGIDLLKIIDIHLNRKLIKKSKPKKLIVKSDNTNTVENLISIYDKLRKLNGLTFTNTIGTTGIHYTKIYFNYSEVCKLNHTKRKIYFNSEMNINITDDFNKIIYTFICDKLFNFNSDLSHIRNDLYKHTLTEESYNNLDNLILSIQNFFNNVQKSTNESQGANNNIQ